MKKRIFPPYFLLFLMVACANPDTNKKQAELEALKKQETELKSKISKLENEIAATDTSKKDEKSKLIGVTEMKQQPFNHYIEVQAKVEGDEDVSVGPETMGTVTSVLARAGEHVTKGQVLATLDDKTIQQSIAELQTQLDLATTVFTRQKNLWDQKIGSEVQYLQAKANKESLEKRKNTLSEQWNMMRIKSPIDGVVDNVDLKVGQAVMPGMAAFRVVNLSLLKVKGEVAESYISKVQQGNDVVLYFPDQDKEVKTKVNYSSKAINKLNRTFNVEIVLKAGDGDFYPNQVAILKIVDYTTPGAYVVPVGAIQKSSDGEFVYVAETQNGKNVVKRKTIQSGMTSGGLTEIKSGIAAGDKVITNGYQNIVEGDIVKI